MELASFRQALIENLRQETGRREFPFIYLDPPFAFHSGFKYWHNKFSEIIRALADKKKLTYLEALKYLAKK